MTPSLEQVDKKRVAEFRSKLQQTRWQRTFDVAVHLALGGYLIFLGGCLLLMLIEPADAMLILPVMCGATLFGIAAVMWLKPQWKTIPFDHFAIVERCGSFHRKAERGLVFIWSRYETIVAYKTMRSEGRILRVSAYTKEPDGARLQVTMNVEVKVKAIPGIDADIAYYRLMKVESKIYQFGEDSIRDLIAENQLQRLMGQQSWFVSALTELMNIELLAYFHQIRDISIKQVFPSEEAHQALQQVFLARQDLEAARYEAAAHATRTLEVVNQLLASLKQLFPTASEEQLLSFASQIAYTGILPKVAEGGNTFMLGPGNLGSISPDVRLAIAPRRNK